MYEQPTLAGKTAGALELLGGGLGMRHSLNLAPRATAARTAAEDIRTTRATPHLDAVIASRNKVFSDAGILPQDIARFTDEDSDVIYQYLLGHPVKGANEAMAKYGIPPLEKFPPSNLSKGGIELETTNPAHMEALKGTIDDSLESRFNAMMESKGATTKAVGKSGIKDIELDIKPIQKSASPEFDPTSLQGLKPAETSGARPVNIGIAPSKIKVAKQIITDYDTRIDLAKMSDEQIIDMAESIDPTRTTASAPVPKTKAGGKPPKPPSTKGDMLFSEELPPDANIQARKQPAVPERTLAGEIYHAPKSLMTVDLPFMTSAALRQARPLSFTPAWFKAWGTAAKSFGSEEAYKAIQNNIASNKYFKPRYQPITNLETGEILRYVEKPSIAEELGVKMSDLKNLTGREEQIASSLTENIPVYGRYIRASNRAYTAFLNDLRMNKFNQLMEGAKAAGRNPETDLVFGEQLAEFVNAATGRGKLEFKFGRSGRHNVNFEDAAKEISYVMWSPRNLASQVSFFNPSTYMQADPMVRRKYINGLARTIGSWGAFSSLAGITGLADVSMNPLSADFGKLRIGNTRIDPGGGYQPLTTLMSRGIAGETTSSTSNETKNLGGYGNTFGNVLGSFAANRLDPTSRLAFDIINATSKEPVHLGDRLLQMVLPFYVNDITQAAQEDPYVAALVGPVSSIGMNTQTYAPKSFGKPTFIPEDMDFNIKSVSPMQWFK